MKRKTLCAFIVLIGISLLFSMNACKKEQQKQQNKSELSNELSQQVLKLVDNFIKNKSSKLKDGESLSVDSTIWYLETAMNATYARMDSITKVLLTDSAFISIPMNRDGTINLSDVYTAYNQLVDSLSVFYYSVNGDKSVLVNDVFKVGIANNQLQVGINMILAQLPTPPHPPIWFGTIDNWIWGNQLGKCDYTLQPRDASTELTTHANYNIPIAPPGQYYTYVNVEKTPMIYPTDVPLPQGQTNPYGYFNSYLFRNSGNVYMDECLTYNVMNYYLQNLFTISTIYQPQGKEIIKYEVWYDYAVGSGYLHIHRAKLTYGTRIIAYYPAINPPSGE
jgi:hypothetical protein